MTKTFEIKLDVEKNLYTPMQILFNVSSNDIGSIELLFEITQDDAPFDLTGKTLQMGIKKPSGAVIYEGITITSAIAGEGTSILPQNAYVESGIHIAEVYIKEATETIVISPFYFNSWESIQATETVPEPTGDVYWQNILSKPLTFPPDAHNHAIADVTGLQSALDSKANVGETGGGGTTPVEDNLLSTSTTNALSANQGRILDTTKADIDHTHDFTNDITGKPATYPPDTHSHDFTTGITGKPLTYPPDTHSHTFDSITGKPATYPSDAHDHAIADVTGLQLALDGKMDDGDAYLKIDTYNKTEVYNKTEIDQMTFDGGGSNVIVEDNLTSTSTTNALSSNQGRVLNTTKSDVGHNHTKADITDFAHVHTSTDITDFATGVAGAIPPEYLTQTEGDARYQATGTIPAHDHAEYLTESEADLLFLTPTEGDARYQAINTVPTHSHAEYLTETEADALFLTQTEGDARYQATGTVPTHTHAEYLDQTEADALYQPINTVPTHQHTKADITDFAHQHTKADITDFGHNHVITDVTNLQTTLDGKQPKPITTTALPTSVPTHAGQMAVDTTNKNTYIAEGTASGDWKKLVDAYDLSLKADVGHSHTSANISDFGTAVANNIPAEYLTQTEGDGRYQATGVVPTHTHTKANITDFAHTHTEADLTIATKNAKTYVDDADNYIMNTRMAGLTLWKGTQAEYDVLTPSATTLYFITG